jgi:pimeloyl-ACP methyl ester carboxylesterase
VIATFEKQTLHTSGGDLAFAEAGAPDAPALLLLHGFPMSSFEWRDLLPLFASRFRVIAPDLLGSGDSSKSEATLHMQAQAGYMRELLGAIGVERFAVVGHGGGGGVAQLLALDGAGVDAMILLDSGGLDGHALQDRRELRLGISDGDADGPLPLADLAEVFDLGMRRRERLTEDALTEYLRPFSAAGGATAFLRLAGSLGAVGLAGREEELARIDAPVLILWGEDDPFLPVASAELLNDSIPSSSLGLLPGCGHFLVEEAGETIGPMIHEYLRARYLRAPHDHDRPGAVPIQLGRGSPWTDLEEDEKDDWFDVDDDETKEGAKEGETST